MLDFKLNVLNLLFLYSGVILANYMFAYFGDKNFKKAFDISFYQIVPLVTIVVIAVVDTVLY